MTLKEVHFIDLGLVEYQKCWDLQTKLFDETVQQKIHNRKKPQKLINTKNHLIFLYDPSLSKIGSKVFPLF